MGIQTLSESVQYEIEKKKREANKVLRKDKDKVDYLSMGPKLVSWKAPGSVSISAKT